jgi:hypothetical protein
MKIETEDSVIPSSFDVRASSFHPLLRVLWQTGKAEFQHFIPLLWLVLEEADRISCKIIIDLYILAAYMS